MTSVLKDSTNRKQQQHLRRFVAPLVVHRARSFFDRHRRGVPKSFLGLTCPNEILGIILSFVGGRTLLLDCPQVNKKWLQCCLLTLVDLDTRSHQGCGTLDCDRREDTFPNFSDSHMLVLLRKFRGVQQVYFNCRSNLISVVTIREIAFKGYWLKNLSVSNVDWMDDSMLQLFTARCPLITHLNLSRCQNITDDGLQFIPRLTHLTTLGMHGLQVSDAGFAILNNCANISTLSLLACTHSGEGIAKASAMVKNLKLLNVFSQAKVGPNMTVALNHLGANLSVLALSNCSIDKDGFASIGQNCAANLTEIFLSAFYTSCTDSDLSALSKCKNLQKLYISDCWQVTGTALAVIATNCRFLSELTFGAPYQGLNANVNLYKSFDVGIEAIAKYCSIHTLCLHKCYITDTGLRSIGAGIPTLKTFDLIECHGITDAGLLLVAKRCYNLVSSEIDCCAYVTELGERMIARRCASTAHHINFDDITVPASHTIESTANSMLKATKLSPTSISISNGISDNTPATVRHGIDLHGEDVPTPTIVVRTNHNSDERASADNSLVNTETNTKTYVTCNDTHVGQKPPKRTKRAYSSKMKLAGKLQR
eukprot:m.274783 g.274783  ORF g.274783 m.274783 type:complete len:595 (+) comp115038_c0_seq1:132-1916(+)